MESETGGIVGGAAESNGQELPPMTPVEEKKYGEMARKMKYFHDFFISEFNDIYDLADGGFNEAGMSLSMFLQTAKTFKKHLEGHHNIEERWIFPLLAKKMPAFRDDDRHQAQHKRIHHGLDELEALVKRYSENPSSYSPTELRACLDAFRETLMRHLNDEVHDLKAENLRKYWTLEELKAIPM